LKTTVGFQVEDLRVESIACPLGVDAPQPRLSWRLSSARGSTRQAAYRVSVANEPEGLDAQQPDLWDSGKKSSSETLDVVYRGKPLQSRARAWWRVESWDEQGNRAEARSWWEMGLLKSSDWSAQWLAVEAAEDRGDRETNPIWTWGEQPRHEDTRKFRFRFSVAESVDAVLMIAGRDRLDGVWIDGISYPALRPTPIDFVAPPMTELRVRLLAGDHVVAAEASFNPALVLPSPTGRFCALLRLRYADGRIERLATPAGWKTSVAAPAAWQSRDFDDTSWHAVQAVEDQPNIAWPARPAMLLRNEFKVRGGVRAARLYATALGAFEASLNGQRIGDALLAPEYTDFRTRTPYRTYDVGSLLAAGPNAIGFLVGDGWFASACAPVSRFPFAPAPRRLFAQLELTYDDGSRDVVATDPSWRMCESAVTSSEIYNGEDYDARLEQRGWDLPGADDGSWTRPVVAKPAPTPLVSDITPPVRVVEILEAKRTTALEPGLYLFDFGQNFSGVPVLSVTAPAGTRVTMRFAEIMQGGRIDQSNLRAARATDTYVCRGDPAGETYQPHFTFHGFRYAEVHCPPSIERPQLRAGVIHSDLPLISTFEVDDEVIAGIWRNARWSQRSNFVGVPTDCPQRDERLGWTGDAMVFWDAATLHMDVAAFTRRYLGEVRAAQLEDGAFPVFAPTPWRMPAQLGPTPGWADAGIYLPWMTWRRTGSTAIIAENWAAMTRYLACIRQANPEMRWLRKRGADFGDWLAVDAKDPQDTTLAALQTSAPTTPKDLIASALWAFDCSMMAEMADATGRADDAAIYRSTWKEIVAAFQEAYVADDGTIGNGSQTGYILPLYFGLLTREQAAAAAAHLAAAIRNRGVVLTTGFLGTPFALHVLADFGYEDLAVALLRRTEFPSWGYMLRQGATTMWERWNSDTAGVQMNSFNHYAFGAVSSFLLRRVAGIDAAEPGFRRILVRPLAVSGLGRVHGTLDSPMGRIETRWSVTGDQCRLSVTVPANAMAEVHLAGTQATESGKAIQQHPDVQLVREYAGRTVVQIGSGHFLFATTFKGASP
jgi:alpha-L-rhamnosidase